MDLQTILVAFIVLSALVYAGSLFWRKAKSFSAKNSCGADCGCEAKRANKTINT